MGFLRAEALTLTIHRREYIKVSSWKQLHFIYKLTTFFRLKPIYLCSFNASVWFPLAVQPDSVCGREWIRLKTQAGIYKTDSEAPAWSQEKWMNVKLY